MVEVLDVERIPLQHTAKVAFVAHLDCGHEVLVRTMTPHVEQCPGCMFGLPIHAEGTQPPR